MLQEKPYFRRKSIKKKDFTLNFEKLYERSAAEKKITDATSNCIMVSLKINHANL